MDDRGILVSIVRARCSYVNFLSSRSMFFKRKPVAYSNFSKQSNVPFWPLISEMSRDQWAAHTRFKPAPKYQRFKVDILPRGSQILHWWWYECTLNGLVCTDMILMLTFSCELWLLSTGYWSPRRGLLANRGINPGGITWPWTTGTLPVFQHSETNIVIKNVVFKYVP